MEEINYDIMRYDLDNDGYVCNVYFGCSSGTCVGYTGEIPEGYETLEQWAENANIRAYKIVDGNLVFDANRDYKLKVLYEQEDNDNAHITKKEMGMASTEEINPYTDLFPSHQSAGGYITSLSEEFNKVGNLPTEEVNLSLMETQDLDLIELEFIGNNFLPNTAISSVNNGIAYTQNKDKTIKISGTATDRSTLNLAGTDTSVRNILTFKGSEKYINDAGETIETPTNYLLFGLADGVSIEFYKYDGTDRTLVGIYNGGVISFEEDTNVTQVVLVVDKGITIDTTISPMLQLVSLEHPVLPMTKYKGNLLPDYYKQSSTNNGVEFKYNSNGSYTVNGTATNGNSALYLVAGNKPLTLSAGTYYVIPSGDVPIVFYDGTSYKNYFATSSFTLYEDTTFVNIYLQVANGKTIDNVIVYPIISTEPIMVEKFEKYNGRDGQYYVDGVSTQATRSGKNAIIGLRDAISKSMMNLLIDKDKLATTMYFSLISSVSLNTTNRIYLKQDGSSVLKNCGPISLNANEKGLLTINLTSEELETLKNGTEPMLQLWENNSDIDYTTITFNEVMLSSSSNLSYEEYGVSPSLDYPSEIINAYKAGIYNVVVDNRVYKFTLPEDLRGLSNGVADRLWFDVNGDNGIDIERKVGRVVLDGSEDWNDSWQNSSTPDYIQFYLPSSFFNNNYVEYTPSNPNALCNYFEMFGTVWGLTRNLLAINTHATYTLQVKIAITDIPDLATFKEWLSTHNTEVYYELATYTTSYIPEYSGNEYVYEEYKNNTTLIDLAGNEFTTSDKITIKDNQIVLIKNGSIDKIIENGVEKEPEREEIYLGDTVMPRTYTPYTHAYCHQRVFIGFKYKDPRNVDITKINLKGLISITDIETEYNFTSDDLTKIQNYIMETGTLTEEEIELYDVNGDGVISASDYVLIKNMINGVISNKITGTLEINSTQSKRTIVLRDSEGKIKTSLGLNGATTPSLSTEQLILNGVKQPKIMSGTSLPEEVTEGAVFLLYDE